MVTVCASNTGLAVPPREKREKERETLEYDRLLPITLLFYGPILPQTEVAAQTASPTAGLLEIEPWHGILSFHRSQSDNHTRAEEAKN